MNIDQYIAKYGPVAWEAAQRQVSINIGFGIMWAIIASVITVAIIVGTIVAFRKLRANDGDGLEWLVLILGGCAAFIGLLFAVCNLTYVVQASMNPTYAAIQQLIPTGGN